MLLSELEELVAELRVKAKDEDPHIVFKWYDGSRDTPLLTIKKPSPLSDARVFDGVEKGTLRGGDYMFAVQAFEWR